MDGDGDGDRDGDGDGTCGVCIFTTLMSSELASNPPPGINSGGGLLVSGIVIETREERFIHTIARTANGARV